MNCEKCGMENTGDSVYCFNCGNSLNKPYADESQSNNEQQASNYEQTNNYQQPVAYQQPIAYQQPANYQAPNNNNYGDEHVSPLMWIGIFCINIIPCVGPLIYIIMLFVWAFGSTNKISLKNFAKAQLILTAIGLVLMLLFWGVIAAFVAKMSYSYGL